MSAVEELERKVQAAAAQPSGGQSAGCGENEVTSRALDTSAWDGKNAGMATAAGGTAGSTEGASAWDEKHLKGQTADRVPGASTRDKQSAGTPMAAGGTVGSAEGASAWDEKHLKGQAAGRVPGASAREKQSAGMPTAAGGTAGNATGASAWDEKRLKGQAAGRVPGTSTREKQSAGTPMAAGGTMGRAEGTSERAAAGRLLQARLTLLVTGVLLGAVLLVGGLRGATAGRATAGRATVGRATNEMGNASNEEMAGQNPAIGTFAADRDGIRQEELRQLQAIAADESASQALRDEANRRRMQVLAWMEQEAAIEEVLSARGLECPVVTVHTDSVNVLVRAESLSRQEAGIILELVTRETGITGGNVKIVPIN